MIRTINIGRYISVQGTFLRSLANGKVAVKVGEKTFVGTPVASNSNAA